MITPNQSVQTSSVSRTFIYLFGAKEAKSIKATKRGDMGCGIVVDKQKVMMVLNRWMRRLLSWITLLSSLSSKMSFLLSKYCIKPTDWRRLHRLSHTHTHTHSKSKLISRLVSTETSRLRLCIVAAVSIGRILPWFGSNYFLSHSLWWAEGRELMTLFSERCCEWLRVQCDNYRSYIFIEATVVAFIMISMCGIADSIVV